MSNRDDQADAAKPETTSDEYLALLADARKRLTALRENLIRLNDTLEEREATRDPSARTQQ